jgi:hypothetical protein
LRILGRPAIRILEGAGVEGGAAQYIGRPPTPFSRRRRPAFEPSLSLDV